MNDINAITTLVYNRPRVDAEGAALRTALGTGAAARIIHARLLGTATPPRLFLALRGGPTIPRETVNQTHVFTWWIYDDPAQGYWRINEALRLLAQAYAARRLSLPQAAPISSVTLDNAGPESEDEALGLLFRSASLIVYA